MVLDKLQSYIDDFSHLSTKQDKYAYLLELADSLPPLDASLLISENKVAGCVSQVHISCTFKDGKLYYSGASEALLVKGLVYILVDSFSGQSPQEIVATKPDFLASFGLDETLSPSRMSASYNIFALMQEQAKQHL